MPIYFIYELKLWQNKKGQMFVEMHCFFLIFFFFYQLPVATKGFKNGTSQQLLGPNFSCMFLNSNNFLQIEF